MDSRVNSWLNEIRVLDGGFGSECQKNSHLKIEGHKAWSCRLLKDDPNLVCDIHKSFLRAGCDVISTNTYQAAPHSLAEALEITVPEAVELMRHAVRLARRAIDGVLSEEAMTKSSPISSSPFPKRQLTICIAGSLGPYGACIADGSEYTGVYADTMTVADLVDFHLPRAQILLQAGVDMLAWETIPAAIEVEAICEVMRMLPGAVGWISVASANGQTTVSGDPLHQVASHIKNCDQVFGIGVNCHIPHALIGQALANLAGAVEPCEPANEDGFHPPPCNLRQCHKEEESVCQRKMLLFYANSGEVWVRASGRYSSSGDRGHWVWPRKAGPDTWISHVSKWAKRRVTSNGILPSNRNETTCSFSSNPTNSQNGVGLPLAQWVGGCCRVGPAQIRQLAEWMKPDEFPQKPANAFDLFYAICGSSVSANTSSLQKRGQLRRRSTSSKFSYPFKKRRLRTVNRRK